MTTNDNKITMSDNRMTILINGVGGPTPRSIARALKWYGKYKEYRFIGTDINPYSYGLYEDLYDKTYVIPRAGDDNYWPTLQKIIDDHQIDMALVQPELEVLEWAAKAQADKLPCKALLPDKQLADLLVDKSRMTDVLMPHGLAPESVTIDPQNINFQQIEDQLGYPFWIRGVSGSSGLGSLKVEDRNALQNWLHINPHVDKFIASTFLPGRNLACKMLYHNGQLLRTACGERVNYIMANVAPSGITGNTAFGRLLNEEAISRPAQQAMEVLFDHANVPKHGFFTVDLKEDENGQPFVTEANVRHVAFSLCFAAGGANLAEDAVRLLDNDPTFDHTYHQYQFPEDLIFLRDVDAEPLIMKESDLFTDK